MKKLLLTITLATITLVGCKKAQNQEVTNTTDSKAKEKTTIELVVGASPTPHAEILAQAKNILAKKDINLTVKELSDYIIPNTALDAGELNANFFQHEPYLIDFNLKNKLKNKLVSVGRIHFEPLGIYAGKSNDLKNIKQGAVIGIPSDPTNGARALLLLDDLNIVKVNKDKGFEATEKDLLENKYNIKIKALEAAQLPVSLPDLDFAIINGNYALGANVTDKLLQTESKDSESAKTFGNVIAVRVNDVNKPEIKALVEALRSEEVKKFILDKYKGVVIPVE